VVLQRATNLYPQTQALPFISISNDSALYPEIRFTQLYSTRTDQLYLEMKQLDSELAREQVQPKSRVHPDEPKFWQMTVAAGNLLFARPNSEAV
jgi:hypothetical protein